MSLKVGSPAENWYVVYTKPRSEKKLAEFLERKGIATFLPLIRLRKKWSDRYKWIEKPAFDSYLFVKISYASQSLDVLRMPQTVSFVQNAGEPATLTQDEIDTISIAVEHFSESLVIRDSSQFARGQKVMVNFGPFAGKEGVVEKIHGKTLLVVSFPSLNKSLEVELAVENLGAVNDEAVAGPEPRIRS